VSAWDSAVACAQSAAQAACTLLDCWGSCRRASICFTKAISISDFALNSDRGLRATAIPAIIREPELAFDAQQ